MLRIVVLIFFRFFVLVGRGVEAAPYRLLFIQPFLLRAALEMAPKFLDDVPPPRPSIISRRVLLQLNHFRSPDRMRGNGLFAARTFL